MKPTEFDTKYKELQEIERRMAGYNKETLLSNVLEDHAKAKNLYKELTTALNEFQKQISIKDKNKDGQASNT